MKEESILNKFRPAFVLGRINDGPIETQVLICRKTDPKIKTGYVADIKAYANIDIKPPVPCILTVTKGEE